MKNLTSIFLAIVLFLAMLFTSCRKDYEAAPHDGNGELINSVRFFFDDNSSVALEGNDVVAGIYEDGYLRVVFNRNGTTLEMEIPNYDINAEHGEYNNTNIDLSFTKNDKLYYSAYIFTPVLVGNPPHQVLVADKKINIKTTNRKAGPNATDVLVQIISGSQLITKPISGGNEPVYDKIGFVPGAGGKPNMINLHIKQ